MDAWFEDVARAAAATQLLGSSDMWQPAQLSPVGADSFHGSSDAYEYGPTAAVFMLAVRTVFGLNGAAAWTNEQLLDIVLYSSTRQYHIDKAREFLESEEFKYARESVWHEYVDMTSDAKGNLQFLAVACLARVMSRFVLCQGVIQSP